MAKAFTFKLGDRLNLPGKPHIQAIVTTPRSHMDFEGAPNRVESEEPLYFLVSVTDHGCRDVWWFTESALLAANAPSVDELAGVLKAAARAEPRKSKRR